MSSEMLRNPFLEGVASKLTSERCFRAVILIWGWGLPMGYLGISEHNRGWGADGTPGIW